MTEELATLYFSKTAPVAKFSVGNGTIIVLTFSMVEIIEKTGEVLDFPMKLISSWGYSASEFKLVTIDAKTNEHTTRRYETKEGALIMDFLKHIVDVVLESKNEKRAFFKTNDKTHSTDESINPLKTEEILFDF